MADPDREAVEAKLEPEAVAFSTNDEERVALSTAISLKRIADALGGDSPFLTALGGTLEDASHNHQQRMRNL